MIPMPLYDYGKEKKHRKIDPDGIPMTFLGKKCL